MLINPYVFGAGGGDPYFASVGWLLHCDGTNGSTTVPDSSSYARTVTCLGSTTLLTSSYKFGTASLGFNGINGAATIPDSGTLEPGSGDFTFEAWVQRVTSDVAGIIVDKRGTGASGVAPFIVVVNSGGSLAMLASNDGATYGLNQTTSAGLIPHNDGLFHHVAMVRSGNTFYLFVDGTQEATGTLSGTLHGNSNDWVLGAASPDFVVPLYGFIDETRYTVGVARYTSGFTPPSAAFPDS